MIEHLAAMPKYEAYKNSGVKWLGEVPEPWKIKRLKYVVDINRETLSETTPVTFEIEYVDIGSVSYEKGIEKTEYFTFKTSPSRARRLVQTGDTIISTVRTYLRAIDYIDKSKNKFVYSTGFAVLSPKHINPKFLTSFVWSNAFTNQVEDESKGISYPAINSTDLSNLFFVEPSLPEQTAIAAFLDSKTAQLDQAVAIKEKQIALLKERKQILIQNAVTRGLNPDAPMRDSGVEWIGKIPAHWDVTRLKFIFSETNERTKTGKEILFSLRMEQGLVPHDEVSDKHIPDENLVDYKIVRPGQMVMNRMRAAIGIFGLANYFGLVSPDYAVFNMGGNVFPDYFLRLFKTALIGEQFRLNSKGLGTGSSGFMRLYTENFGDIKVPFPSREEQRAIITYIETESAKIDQAISIQQQQIDKLKEYKATLINSAVTGKIKVPELSGEKNAA